MRFSQLYAEKKPVISLEFFPPKQEANLDSTLLLIRELAAFKPDFMTVTYGAGGGTRALTQEMLRFVHRSLNLPVVSHLTCAGHTRDELKAILLTLYGEGVRRVLALRGDPPKGAAKFVPHPGGFSSALELVRFIRELEQEKNLEPFDLAVAGYPETHREAASSQIDLEYLKAKVDAGADIVLTQLFFDADTYSSFVGRARQIGIHVPIVPGVMPIANVAQIHRFTSMCGATIPPKLANSLKQLESDPEAVTDFGSAYAIEQCEELLKRGAPGIHLYTLNRSHQVKSILERLRKIV